MNRARKVFSDRLRASLAFLDGQVSATALWRAAQEIFAQVPLPDDDEVEMFGR